MKRAYSEKIFWKFIFCFVLLILSGSVLFAIGNEETGGVVEGKITTSDNKPAAEVNVELKEINRAVISDDDGNFIFKHIAEGNYEIDISLLGYETIHQNITVEKNKTTTLSFQLKVSFTQLQEVVVTANKLKSVNEKPVSIGKAGIALKDLPQAATIIDKEVLERQQTQTVGDALMNVNGVYVMGTTGGTQQEIGGRGYLFNSTNTFKNGMKYNNSIMPEITAVDRIEFLKGSAAILLGNVTAGGVMNIVTKKPLFDEGGEISFRAGSYDEYSPALDIYGPVSDSKSVAYRISTSFEKEGSFRNDVSAQRYYINPSFLIKIDKKTQVLVEGDYLTDKHTSDFGIGAINYVICDIPRNTFLGAAWSYNKAAEANISITTTHHFNDNWQLQNITGFYNYTSELFGTSRPDDGGGAAIETNGNWVRGVQRNNVNEDYYVIQFDLTGKFYTGNLKHQVLFGASADKDQINTLAYNLLPVYDSINVFDLNKYPQRTDIPTLTRNTFTHAPLSTVAAYAQDLLSITDKLKLLAALRFSYVQSLSNVYSYSTGLNTVSSIYTHPFTPRVGIIYEPYKNISLFASYSNSFTTNTGTDTAGNALPLSFINQYEAGFKSDLMNKLLSFNVTVYQIINSNLAQMSLANGNTNSNIKELDGQVTSKGVEVDFVTKSINGFNFMAGYSYNDSRYTKSNTYFTGTKLQYAPENIANASVYYTFSKQLKGLSVGVIGMYVNGMNGGRVPRMNPTASQKNYALIPLPDFTRVDATVKYDYKKLSFGVKISNMFNALGFYAHEDGSVNPIAPTQVAATVSCRL